MVPFEEKAGLDWLIRKIKEHKDKESLLAFVSSFAAVGGWGGIPHRTEAKERGQPLSSRSVDSPEDGVVEINEETRPSYTLAAKRLMELPLDQFQKEFARRGEEASRQSGVQDVLSCSFPHAT